MKSALHKLLLFSCVVIVREASGMRILLTPDWESGDGGFASSDPVTVSHKSMSVEGSIRPLSGNVNSGFSRENSSAEAKGFIEYLQDIRGTVNRGRIAYIRAERIEIICHI